MRLDSIYRATFTTPESWAVDLEGAGGVEGQLFLIAEGRSEGRLSARLRAANYPRRRTDGTLLPDFRGALVTDDGATVLFSWQGYAREARGGGRELVGAVMHVTDDPRYAWLNSTVCALTGEVRPRQDGDGFEVVVDVAEIVHAGCGYSSEQEAAIGSPSREV
jgi:hypothetical protein